MVLRMALIQSALQLSVLSAIGSAVDEVQVMTLSPPAPTISPAGRQTRRNDTHSSLLTDARSVALTRWTGRTYGGTGSAHGKFHTCHAMTWDPRVGQMAVSDRANHRVEYFKIDPSSADTFEYTSTVSTPTVASGKRWEPRSKLPLTFKALWRTRSLSVEGSALGSDRYLMIATYCA